MSQTTLKCKDQEVRVGQPAPGVYHLRLSNFLARRIGFWASCYLVDEILIDCGFSRAREVLLRFLADRTVRAVCCTHHHEDHAGNCGSLAEHFGCPVHLHRPEKRLAEGVGRLLPYRRLSWGRPDDYRPGPMPSEIFTGKRTLQVIPTPGHSRTHVAFYQPEAGLLFVGDLYVTGAAGAVMSHENPYQSIRSLRTLAGREARLLLNGHGLVADEPRRRLHLKADRVEAAARRVVELHDRGRSTAGILKSVFPSGQLKDALMAAITQGEFSRKNFVRACLRHRP